MRATSRAGAATRWNGGGRIDLGNEPPLTVGDKKQDTPVRRSVSLRWLSGTILTGLTSIGLMGGALLAALDGHHQFAMPPEAQAAAADGLDPGFASGRKGDRIRPVEQQVASRQVLQVSTVIRQADREVMKPRPFAKITASLSTRRSELADQIPAYDPVRIFAAGTIEDNAPPERAAADQIYGAEVDGEVAVKVSPFPLDGLGPDPTGAFDTAEVEEIVREAAGFVAEGEVQLAALPYVEPGAFAAAGLDPDPFAALGVSIVPENVTLVAKRDGPSQSLGPLEEKLVALDKAVALAEFLRRNDIAAADADDIAGALAAITALDSLPEGMRVRIGFERAEVAGQPIRPVRVSLYQGTSHQATVARADDDRFVRADEPQAGAEPPALAELEAEPEPAPDQRDPMPRLYEAIYQTALEQEVPPELVPELIKIFSYEVDYQSRVSPGDAIEIFHSLAEPGGEEAGAAEILYAAITLNGSRKRFYRYQTADDGVIDYYDPEGKSAKKFLIRKPMTTGRYASGYGYRRHPILRRTRLHTGVDWAAPQGTPIMAAGDGIVEKVGRNSGYGNFTLIRHTNGYTTGYAHQSAFAKGLKPGTAVKQGQVIGYVGSTGLSTGPHLHFEISINGKFVDPLRIRLPRGRVLQSDVLDGFERERDRIDALLDDPPAGGKVAANR